MGTGNSFRVKPPVAARCHGKCKLIILVIVLPYIQVETVRGPIVVRPAFRGTPLLSAGFAVVFQIPAVGKLRLNLVQVGFVACVGKGFPDAHKMRKLRFTCRKLLGKRLRGASQLRIAVKILLGIIYRGESVIERNRNLRIVVIVGTGKAAASRLRGVSVRG